MNFFLTDRANIFYPLISPISLNYNYIFYKLSKVSRSSKIIGKFFSYMLNLMNLIIYKYDLETLARWPLGVQYKYPQLVIHLPYSNHARAHTITVFLSPTYFCNPPAYLSPNYNNNNLAKTVCDLNLRVIKTGGAMNIPTIYISMFPMFLMFPMCSL